jgi:hypothetical protein
MVSPQVAPFSAPWKSPPDGTLLTEPVCVGIDVSMKVCGSAGPVVEFDADDGAVFAGGVVVGGVAVGGVDGGGVEVVDAAEELI